MQIFDKTKGASRQREKQLDINNPIQYFFSFDFEDTVDDNGRKQLKQFYSKLNDQFETFTTVNYAVYPLAKGKIRVRIENMADRFDVINDFEKNGPSTIHYVNMDSFAKDWYLEANPSGKVP